MTVANRGSALLAGPKMMLLPLVIAVPVSVTVTEVMVGVNIK